MKVFQDNTNHIPKFEKNDAVFKKKFGRGANWVPGIIIDILSPRSFLVRVKGVVWRRHFDQLKPRLIPEESCVYDGRGDILKQSKCEVINKRMFHLKSAEKHTAEQQTEEMPQTTDLKSAQVEIKSENRQNDIIHSNNKDDAYVLDIERRTFARERRPTQRLITEDK